MTFYKGGNDVITLLEKSPVHRTDVKYICYQHNPRLGLDVINSVDSQKFPLVLSRICQCIQTSPDNLKVFTDDEEEKLSATLGLAQPDLKMLLDCSTLILKQAAFNITKPSLLQQQLSQHFKLKEDKVEAFVSTWTNHAKNIVEALKHKSTYPQQVTGVSWLLNSAVSSSESSVMMEPRAIIELKLHNEDSRRGNLQMDLDPTQLEELYNTLETIQTRLDSLR